MKDLEVFKPKDRKIEVLEEKPAPVDVGYGERGEVVDPTSDGCYAKIRTYWNGDKDYFVKFNGSELADPFNGITTRQPGMDTFKFRKVALAVFEPYLVFLQKKNATHYHTARRALV